MRRILAYLIICLILFFPSMALIRAAAGHKTDKDVLIMAPILLSLLLVILTIQTGWPQKALFLLNRRSILPSHPSIPLSTISSPSSAKISADVSALDSIRQSLGPIPRQFPLELKNYLRVKMPSWLWLHWEDGLRLNLRHQERIR